jgi:adenylate cyclase
MPIGDEARSAGVTTVSSWRGAFAKQVAKVLRRDPELCDTAIEVGIVDRRWLEEPGDHPLSTSTTLDVVQRFLERSVERKPSALTAIGLNAIQLLSWDRGADPATGLPAEVTIVFTDLEGFTTFTANEGDEAASKLLNEHHRVVGPIVRGRGGKVVKRLGDGLLLSFPSPEAAVLAALELVPAAPEPLRMRAGMHCGEAVVTRDDVIGHVVNVAARVAESAKGGQVAVTGTVRDAVGSLPGIVFSRSRRRTFKGVGEAIPVCRVEVA